MSSQKFGFTDKANTALKLAEKTAVRMHADMWEQSIFW